MNEYDFINYGEIGIEVSPFVLIYLRGARSVKNKIISLDNKI